MNNDLVEVLEYYSTKEHKELNNLLIGKSKDNLISILLDLLTTYINDKNSSTIREFLTVTLSGYTHSTKKIGFNGYKQNSVGEPLKAEAKPKNYDTHELEKYKKGKRKSSPAKLNGGGNFTDYTYARLERDKKEKINMLISGFVDGKLIYILEFPIQEETLCNRLLEQLKKRFPNGKDIFGEYLRSASFSYRDYIESNDLKIIYLVNKEELKNYSNYIDKNFLKYLLNNE